MKKTTIITKKVAGFEAIALIPMTIMAIIYSCIFARELTIDQDIMHPSTDFVVDDFLALWAEIFLAHVPYICAVAVIIAIIAIVVAKRKE